jgi:tetratricopeptide (TPR) repeat protein
LAIGASLNNLGAVALSRGEYARARSQFEEAVAMWREVGNTHGTALALNNLGLVAFGQGDNVGARSLYEESLAIRRELGDKGGIASSLHGLGEVARVQGSYADALSLYKESLVIRRELGDKMGIVWALVGLGELAVAIAVGTTKRAEGTEGTGGVEQAQRGATILSAAEGLLEAIGAIIDPEDRIAYEQGVGTARSLLGEEAFAKAWAEGRAMSMEQSIAYALEES